MGIDNDSLLCYGIEFEYNQIKHLKDAQEFKKVAEDIGCDDMPDLWQEMGFVNGSEYYDAEAEDQYYIIGKEIIGDLTLTEFLNNVNEKETKEYIKGICEKYGLMYSEPRIIYRAYIS